MKRNRIGIVSVVCGVLCMAITPVAFAQTTLYFDNNGPTSGIGGVGDWDTVSTNWTTALAGNIATFAWTNVDHPAASRYRAYFSQSTAGTVFAPTPTAIANVVGTQTAGSVWAQRGAHAVLTNGTLLLRSDVDSVGSGRILIAGNADNQSNNILRVYSDILIGNAAVTNGNAYPAILAGSATLTHHGTVNNTIEIHGNISAHSDMDGIGTFGLFLIAQTGTNATVGTNKIVLGATSSITLPSDKGNWSVRFGWNGQVQDAQTRGRYEVYSTNNTQARTDFFGGTTVVYVDSYKAAPGGSSTFGFTDRLNFGVQTLAGVDIAFLTGISGITISDNMRAGVGTGNNRDFIVTLGGEHTSGTSTYTGLIELADLPANSIRMVNLTAAQGGTVRFLGNLGNAQTPVTKIGLGTVELAGTNNNYGGATTVSDGTLLISGKLTGNGAVNVNGGSLIVNGEIGTGAVTVALGGTLAGTGIVKGHTTVSGTLSPGNSPGDLSFEGNLTLNSGATSFFEVGGKFIGQYDRVLLNGFDDQALAYGGTLELDIWSGAAVGDTFTLFSGFTSQSGNFSSINLV
ncbi:MAG: hypothetical protein U1E27_03105, partial [Kiritimatiellia bacterium]|nr:hypothetical protein [Kiritimatiellia bacterium]